ncbi:MAG: ABC transporter permease [Planctomyces sp.]|nr:ABC transporter permease [Planctomyces sp.]
MLSFAWKTLICDRGKVLTALVGVVFSVVLVEIQGGLYVGLMRKARILTDHAGAEIWVGHPDVQLVDLPQAIPETLVNRVRTAPGVLQAEPYVLGNAFASFPDGHYENVWVLGSNLARMLGTGWNFVEGGPAELRRPNGVSVDRQDRDKLGDPSIGTVFEINGQRARVVARTDGILPFTTTPYLFTSIDNARRYTGTPSGSCSYFLVKVAPDADLATVAANIQQRVPELKAFTAAELGRRSENYWMQRTGIGISFGAATLLGLFVGLLMVGQSLYALALDHLTDYATLKAIGAGEGQLLTVVFAQACIIAAIGAAIGLSLVALIVNTLSTPIAPIEIPRELLVGAVALVLTVCVSAAVLPYLRIRQVDPATVLQG